MEEINFGHQDFLIRGVDHAKQQVSVQGSAHGIYETPRRAQIVCILEKSLGHSSCRAVAPTVGLQRPHKAGVTKSGITKMDFNRPGTQRGGQIVPPLPAAQLQLWI